MALVFIGFDAGDLDRGGLTGALRGDPVILANGGHHHTGQEAAALDLVALEQAVAAIGDQVMGYAVAALFATRNPAHEIAARDIIRRVTGRPVTCSHELSANLNGPKRALTAVLNARLIGMIERLVTASERHLARIGVNAPLMVVRGDGALISAAMARERPIETILSGPAASIVGARWLTGAKNALVSDIGGTTTDVALLRDGLPEIDPQGARVGGFRTMVEAVAMRTTGLGGDSEVHLITEGLEGGLCLGPRRMIPVSLLAQDHGAMVHAALDRALASDVAGDHDGRFVVPMIYGERGVGQGVGQVAGQTAGENGGENAGQTAGENAGQSAGQNAAQNGGQSAAPNAGQTAGISAREAQVLARISAPMPLAAALTSRLEFAALDRLVARGLVMIAGVTPSDASHVLGRLAAWDGAAAQKAVRLLARRRNGRGDRFAPDAATLAQAIVDQLTAQTVDCLLEAAFGEDPAFAGEKPEALARHSLLKAGLDGHRGVLDLTARLGVPVIGLGASAPSYYAAVGRRLGCEMILPDHAGVANAIGAVVGQVSQRATGLVTSPGEGRFVAHIAGSLQTFTDRDTALQAMETALIAKATDGARAAGAEEMRITTTRDLREAMVEGRAMFIEATLTATASGRPRVAHRAKP